MRLRPVDGKDEAIKWWEQARGAYCALEGPTSCVGLALAAVIQAGHIDESVLRPRAAPEPINSTTRLANMGYIVLTVE